VKKKKRTESELLLLNCARNAEEMKEGKRKEKEPNSSLPCPGEPKWTQIFPLTNGPVLEDVEKGGEREKKGGKGKERESPSMQN